MSFNQNILEIDAKAEIDRIVQTLRDCVVKVMHKRGAVLGSAVGLILLDISSVRTRV